MDTTTRNADLSTFAAMLKEQAVRKFDLVAPAANLRSEGGVIVAQLPEPIITDAGVTTEARFVPTAVFDEGVAEKLGIPLAYVRRMRADRPDLYDSNVNGWLHGSGLLLDPTDADHPLTRYPADPRSFMLRTFRGDDGPGIARALLSDKYSRIDHLDCLTAALAGVEQAGVAVDVYSADLTDRRMVVRVSAPEVLATAPRLLEGYRSPFPQSGPHAGTQDVVFGGFEISNSETGGGAFTITPRLLIQVCKNGLKITKDAMRSIHVGGRMDEGVIEWSDATQQRQLDLITSKTSDAVRTFLNVEYLERTIVALEAKGGEPVETPDAVTKLIGQKGLGFTEAEVDGILGHFIRGGQTTTMGVVNAITAHAQEVADGDAAYRLESKATTLLGV